MQTHKIQDDDAPCVAPLSAPLVWWLGVVVLGLCAVVVALVAGLLVVWSSWCVVVVVVVVTDGKSLDGLALARVRPSLNVDVLCSPPRVKSYTQRRRCRRI